MESGLEAVPFEFGGICAVGEAFGFGAGFGGKLGKFGGFHGEKTTGGEEFLFEGFCEQGEAGDLLAKDVMEFLSEQSAFVFAGEDEGLFEVFAIGNVPDHADEVVAFPGFDFANRKLHGELLAVLPESGDFTSDADDAGLAGSQVFLNVAGVLLLMGGGHEEAYIFANDFFGGIAKHPGGSVIKGDDFSLIVDEDDALDGGFQNGGEEGLGVGSAKETGRFGTR